MVSAAKAPEVTNKAVYDILPSLESGIQNHLPAIVTASKFYSALTKYAEYHV